MQQLQNLDIDVLVDVSMKADLTYYFNMYNTQVRVWSMLVWDRCIGRRGEGWFPMLICSCTHVRQPSQTQMGSSMASISTLRANGDSAEYMQAALAELHLRGVRVSPHALRAL